MSANFNIHPTYIQMLETDKRYSKVEKMKSINSFKIIEATSYDPKNLRKFVSYKNFKGNWNANNWCLNKNLIILGGGPSLKK